MSMQLPSSKRIGINQIRDEIFRNMTKILSDIGQGRGQPWVTDDEEFLMCQHSTPHVIYYVDLSRENTELFKGQRFMSKVPPDDALQGLNLL